MRAAELGDQRLRDAIGRFAQRQSGLPCYYPAPLQLLQCMTAWFPFYTYCPAIDAYATVCRQRFPH